MKLGKQTGLVGVILLFSIVASGWGFTVHKTVTQLSVYVLPKKMQAFFYRNIRELVADAVRPDLRRNTDSTEASKHFIDLEAYGDSAAYKIPLQIGDAIHAYTWDTLQQYGYVPYEVVRVKNKLTEQFKAGNRDSIIYYAADLAHYIADANVPLHTTINYDGQLTNQKGLHSLWETVIPEAQLDRYTFNCIPKAAYLANPASDIMASIRQAHRLLPELFLKEKEITARFTDSTKYVKVVRNGREYRNYSPEFVAAYSQSLGNSINCQLVKSAKQIADFWYTCWVDAGQPDLNFLMQPTATKEEKNALRNELKVYKKNRLITDSLLLAKKPITNT